MFTSRELATVLAALRHWQELVERPGEAMPYHFGQDCEPLDGAEIDELCERLNVAEQPDRLTAEGRVLLRDKARAIYAADSNDDIEINDAPKFSVCEGGVWVQGWLFVAKEAEYGDADA